MRKKVVDTRLHKKTGEATGFSKLTNSKNTNSNNLVPGLNNT